MLVRIIKNWDYPDIIKQIPTSIIDSDIHFTTEEIEKCDLVIVLNYLTDDVIVNCAPENVWAIMQEPFVEGVFGWMVEKHEQFSLVFTHSPPKKNLKYITSHPALPWHINKSFKELEKNIIPQKEKNISWVTSKKYYFPGHKKRLEFIEFLQDQNQLKIEIFGKGIQFILDKWDALAPFKYSIAVENSTNDNYWTEKISDCFLAYSLPFYFGCQNIENYYPKESFIPINISDPHGSIKIIKNAINQNEWEKRFEAIQEARRMVLYKHNFFIFLERQIKMYYQECKREKLRLKAYHPSLKQKGKKRILDLKNKIYRLIN